MNASLPVLVVDDSSTIRMIVSKHLNKLGYADIDLAEDGGSALALLGQRSYELMISDWEMQPMGGEQLIKAVRENAKTFKLPIIMLTATATRGTSWLAGADAYLSKPFSESDFQKAIKTVFGPR
jgi:two-component system chemotaxis response regulator CheY